MPMTGAHLAARTLIANGVTTVFTLCGDHTSPLLEALSDEGVRLIDTRDERGAAWMAAGWALGTGRPGVVIVSNTPALLNAATALADSDASQIPVVCITGGVARGDRGGGHPGDLDQTALAAPWSRTAMTATAPAAVGHAITAAFAAAIRPPRGVAVIDLPMDVQRASTDAAEPAALQRAPLAPSPTSIGHARTALQGASAPVVIAGEGCWFSGAGDALRSLVERGRIPAFTARAARGMLDDDHDLCFGFPNLLAAPAQAALGEADVAIIAGARLDLSLAGGGFHPGCTVIRIEDHAPAFEQGRAAEIPVHADPALALTALVDGLEPLPTSDWVTRLQQAAATRRGELDERARDDRSPMHPGRVMAEVSAVLPADAIVVADAGEFALWAVDALGAHRPAGFHASSFSATGALGMGMPWSIGLALAHPEREAFLLAGDGSFGFTALELETAARHDLPITVVIGNDAGWGIVRHVQRSVHGRPIASDLPAAPFTALASFAGAHGTRVDDPDALRNALTRGLPGARLIDAVIDAEVRHPALPFIASMFD